MSELTKLMKADLKNLLRIKWLWLYLVFLSGGTYLFLYMSNDITKVVLSLLNVSLLVVPLVSAFFSITYFYDSRNFIEFMLSQPVCRKYVFLSKFLSVSVYVGLLYSLGVLIPLLKEILSSGKGTSLILLVVSGSTLSVLFSSLAFLIGTAFDDKAKGVSLLLGVWLYLSVLHDGLILGVIYLFREYPLEEVVLALTLLNPVDLARLLVVLNLDIAALMGVSGTVIKDFFGSGAGIIVISMSIGAWIVVPTAVALRLFSRKDF